MGKRIKHAARRQKKPLTASFQTDMHIDFAFIDSGMGGLPYLAYLQSLLPSARCLYAADTGGFPYGTKPAQAVQERAFDLVSRIIEIGTPRAVIIACNTMSVIALAPLRTAFPSIPFVGTVPAVKLAASLSRTGTIGLLATERTVHDSYTQKLIDTFAADCRVLIRGDPALVDFIEKRYFSTHKDERIQAVRPAVDFFMQGGADCLVLGCTHFIHAAKDIQEAASGRRLLVVDSREGVIQQALRVACLHPETGTANMQPPSAHTEANSAQARGASVQHAETAFYHTGFVTEEREAVYRSLCPRFGLSWKGGLGHRR